MDCNYYFCYSMAQQRWQFTQKLPLGSVWELKIDKKLKIVRLHLLSDTRYWTCYFMLLFLPKILSGVINVSYYETPEGPTVILEKNNQNLIKCLQPEFFCEVWDITCMWILMTVTSWSASSGGRWYKPYLNDLYKDQLKIRPKYVFLGAVIYHFKLLLVVMYVEEQLVL